MQQPVRVERRASHGWPGPFGKAPEKNVRFTKSARLDNVWPNVKFVIEEKTMGREVRRVPSNWEHPFDDEEGDYVPIELEEMPAWPEDKKTYYQMYENCTEGTPISPPMASPEELARWLVDNNASRFASHTASYEEWLIICYGAIATSGRFIIRKK